MPKVSVVITCFNYGRYLADAVDSVMRQSLQDFEIVIVDDGSTDDTRSVAGGLITKHKGASISLISQENKGFSGARNAGIKAAAGEYIMPLDADDMLAPEYLEHVAGLLDSDPGLSFAYTDGELFGEKAHELACVPVAREYDFARLLRTNIISFSGMFRKSAWEETGGYKSGVLDGYYDWEFWITLGESGRRGGYVDRPLYLCRKHGGSRMDSLAGQYNRIYNQIRMLHPKVYAPFSSRVSINLARAVIKAQSWLVDPVTHYLYRKHPRLHSFLREKVKLFCNIGWSL